MTLLLLEGFEGAGTTEGSSSGADMRDYLNARYPDDTNFSATSTGSPRVEIGWGNGKGLSMGDDSSSDNNRYDISLGSLIATAYIGFVIRPGRDVSPTQIQLFALRDDGNNRDVFQLKVGDRQTLMGFREGFARITEVVVPNILKPNVWTYIEVRVTASTTVGVCEIRINGTEVLNETGLNISAFGSVTFDVCRINGQEGTGVNDEDFQWVFDDMYIDDAGFQGPIKIEGLFPTAEGATINFTPSTGTDNSANVDENPKNDDTDYNSSADTASNKDLFTTQNLSNVDGGIIGVQISSMCRIDAAGDIGMQSIVAEGTPTQGTGAVVEVTSQSWATSVQHIFETNPDTASAWAVSEVDGMEIGYEVD
jgi:hypothetical protein